MSIAERETGSRIDFLETVRRAVTAPHAHATRPVVPLPSPLPPVAYAAPPEDRPAAFAAALSALGGVVRSVEDTTDLASLIDEAVTLASFTARGGVVRVAVTDEPECAAIVPLLAERDDVELLVYDSAVTVAAADLGITGALAGVALTGSIVVDAARAGGRTVSLLPPVHLALVAAQAIVATPGESWRAMADPMASNVVQITGPSRSADIELVITLGVHGPRALLVGVLTDFEREAENET